MAPKSVGHKAIAVGLGVTFAAFYFWMMPSVRDQTYDSLNYAYQGETYGLRGGIMGNHALAHIIQNAVFAAVRECGYTGRALPVMSALNAAWAGGAVGVGYLLGARLLAIPWPLALSFAVVLGGSRAMLRYSATADVYALTVLTQVVAWYAIVNCVVSGRNSRWVVAGMLAGISVVAHQLGILVMAGGCCVAWFMGRWRAVVELGLGAAVVGGCGFTIVSIVATASLSPSTMLSWVVGYGAGGTAYGGYLVAENVPLVLSTAVGALIHPGWSIVSNGASVAIGVAVVVLSVRGGSEERQQLRRLWYIPASLALLGELLAWWWEPWNMKFHLLALLHAWLACLMRWARSGSGVPDGNGVALWRGVSALVAATVLLLFNARFQALPSRSLPPHYVESLNAWVAHTRPGDTLLTLGDFTPQLRFLEHRPNTLSRSELASAADLLKAIQVAQVEGADVYIADDPGLVQERLGRNKGLSAAEMRTVFGVCKTQYAFEYVNDFDRGTTTVYRVTRRRND